MNVVVWELGNRPDLYHDAFNLSKSLSVSCDASPTRERSFALRDLLTAMHKTNPGKTNHPVNHTAPHTRDDRVTVVGPDVANTKHRHHHRQ